MKHELTLILASVFIVLGAAFFFYTNTGFTGYVVYNDSSSVDIVSLNISEGQANISIGEAEGVIIIMQSNNFTHRYMDDELTGAKRVFQQAKYAEVIRTSKDENGVADAKKALQLVNWQSITFNDVIPYVSDIKQRKINAFEIYDSISILRKDIQVNLDSGFDVTSADNMADNAERAFYQERYNDSRDFIIQSRNLLESSVSGTSTLSGIQNGAKNFVQKYWMQIIIFIAVFAWVISLLVRQYNKAHLADEIKSIKRERDSLTGLMKKTQNERYKENKISEWVYGIRMKHYKERMNVINEKLPVMQARLRQLKGEEDKH